MIIIVNMIDKKSSYLRLSKAWMGPAAHVDVRQ